jgi:hypothetical protein
MRQVQHNPGAQVPSFHRDNQSVFKERIFLDKANANLLHDEITVIDHALTRPWTKGQAPPDLKYFNRERK